MEKPTELSVEKKPSSCHRDIKKTQERRLESSVFMKQMFKHAGEMRAYLHICICFFISILSTSK